MVIFVRAETMSTALSIILGTVPSTELSDQQIFVEQIKYVHACMCTHTHSYQNLFAYSLEEIKATFKECLQGMKEKSESEG